MCYSVFTVSVNLELRLTIVVEVGVADDVMSAGARVRGEWRAEIDVCERAHRLR